MNEHMTPKESRDSPPEHWLKLLGKMFSLLSGIIRCKNAMTLGLLVTMITPCGQSRSKDEADRGEKDSQHVDGQEN